MGPAARRPRLRRPREHHGRPISGIRRTRPPGRRTSPRSSTSTATATSRRRRSSARASRCSPTAGCSPPAARSPTPTRRRGTSFKGLDLLFLFDPWTERWSIAGRMRHGRWYPSQVELADGRIAILAGLDESGLRGRQPRARALRLARQLDHARARGRRDAERRSRTSPYYPHLFTMPGGDVLLGGSAAASPGCSTRARSPAPSRAPHGLRSWTADRLAGSPSTARLRHGRASCPGAPTRAALVGGYAGDPGRPARRRRDRRRRGGPALVAASPDRSAAERRALQRQRRDPARRHARRDRRRRRLPAPRASRPAGTPPGPGDGERLHGPRPGAQARRAAAPRRRRRMAARAGAGQVAHVPLDGDAAPGRARAVGRRRLLGHRRPARPVGRAGGRGRRGRALLAAVPLRRQRAGAAARDRRRRRRRVRYGDGSRGCASRPRDAARAVLVAPAATSRTAPT